MNKGQAALEFLSTYGFAFVVLIITLAVISYTGIFNVASLRSNECNFPQGAECIEFALGTADNGSVTQPFLRLILYNSYGVNLTITETTLSMTEFPDIQICTPVVTNAWPRATNTTIWCTIPPESYHKSQRYDGVITLNFTQQNGNYNHTIKGTVSVIANQ